MPSIIESKRDLLREMRQLREGMRGKSPFAKAKDLALEMSDAFAFSDRLRDLLVIDALTEIARTIIHRQPAGGAGANRASAGASAGGSTDRTGSEREPPLHHFEEICSACPGNYAVPGKDDPADTVYAETFDSPCSLLPAGIAYLRKAADGAQRNATALENLYLLCREFGFAEEETPRDVLGRQGYSPGDGE